MTRCLLLFLALIFAQFEMPACSAAELESTDKAPGRLQLVKLDLGGAWTASETGAKDWFPAKVPGCIHTDLQAAGRIPDPFYRDNESKVQWVGQKDWTYRRNLDLPAAFLQHQHLILRCEGLDTLASVLVNGTALGQVDNMFRTWEFDAKKVLHPGENVIEIQFKSVLPFIEAKEREKHLPTWAYPGAGYVRKMPCSFGWDWGPTLITCGIWRDISLLGFDEARLNDVQILQDHSQSGKVGLKIHVGAENPQAAPLMARVSVTDPHGRPLKPVNCELGAAAGEAEVSVTQPQIWWPAGMGAHPLYTVKVELLDAQGQLLDSTSKRIGLRTLKALQQTDKAPMQFEVNGVVFFAKGASWVPADAFPTRVTQEQQRRFVEGAVAANFNSLRFWGGGYYEDDALFDACDELGICVWMDCKFACSTYPAFDSAFLDNVKHEVEDNVKRLRHHPSIAVWCGNNEIMFFRGKEWDYSEKGKMSEADYYTLFRDTVGGVVRTLDPQHDYVTGSPDCGDTHYWEVWHGGKPFEDYRNMHGFVSEFGFQSFAVPATVDSFTDASDRTNVYSPVVKYHERSNRMYMGVAEDGTIGTDKIMKIVRLNFREPKDFESALWLSQINQAYGIEFAAEGWRREMPRSMGCLFWQYNDDWPCTSWSSVDYFGRWKALQYRARHFYAPLLVSGVYNPTNKEVELWLTSDEMSAAQGKIKWSVTDLAGEELRAGEQSAAVKAHQSGQVGQLAIGDLIAQHGTSNVVVWLSFGEGKQAAHNIVMLTHPREMELRNPQPTVSVSGAGKDFSVKVKVQRPAFWMWLEAPGAEAHYSDNFVHVAPNQPATWQVALERPMTRKDFSAALRVRSVYDTSAALP